MNKIKLIGSIIVSIIIALVSVNNVEADVKNNKIVNYVIQNENLEFKSSTFQNEIGRISIKYSFETNGQKNYLFPTFDDINQALEVFKKQNKDFVNIIKEYSGLEELEVNNLKEYESALNSYLKEPFKEINYSENSNEVVLYRLFMEYYENQKENEEIINYINDNLDKDLSSDRYFLAMLPYTTPLVQNFSNECKKEKIKQNIGIAVLRLDDSTMNEISYAYKYANHRNYDYDYFDADCTNFVSQILESSGYEQDSVWWHYQDMMGVNYQSATWINANRFVNYFGTIYSSTSHYGFSAYLKAGDIIALDIDNTGHWNHCGFVIASDNYLTDGYYDYLVAQHTADYIAWTSSEINGWDNYAGGGNTYGVIRP